MDKEGFYMELIFKQQFQVTTAAVDCFGRLKPSMLLYYCQEVAGNHCIQLGTDYDSMAAKDMFWAIIRQKVQINRLPMVGETITVETWPMPTTRVAYPRSMVAYDADGNELFRSISLWVLINGESRAMVLPGKSGVDVTGTLKGTELASPRSLAPAAAGHTERRTVTYSCLDRNGHMNNPRYLDWVGDLLPSQFYSSHSAREFLSCYLSEAMEGPQIHLNWDLSADGCLQVDAHREASVPGEKLTRVFSAQVLF